MKNNPYFIINVVFTGIILVILIYSGIFSASGLEHPIKSIATHTSVSTGLSRAFSEIVRLNFQKAIAFNPYALNIFLFFIGQLLLRIMASYMLLSNIISKKLLLIADVLLSVLLFLFSFFRFISDQF